MRLNKKMEENGYPLFIGVSPDGIAKVKVPGDKYEGIDSQWMTVEIKTRVAENTIYDAEVARDEHGAIVTCEYGDCVFKKCVPAQNRAQVIHQSLVTGLPWAAFITAKVWEEEGSIVQTVFVSIDDEDKAAYSESLLKLATPLLGWIFDPAVVRRGYMIDGDFPLWVDDKARKILKSRFKMWCALYTHVQTKGAMKPLRLIKHYTQFDYNKGKWGLDKCTELANEVRLQGKYGCEQKYICRLIDGVLVNSWIYDKSTIIKPWATDRLVNGSDPSA